MNFRSRFRFWRWGSRESIQIPRIFTRLDPNSWNVSSNPQDLVSIRLLLGVWPQIPFIQFAVHFPNPQDSRRWRFIFESPDKLNPRRETAAIVNPMKDFRVINLLISGTSYLSFIGELGGFWGSHPWFESQFDNFQPNESHALVFLEFLVEFSHAKTMVLVCVRRSRLEIWRSFQTRKLHFRSQNSPGISNGIVAKFWETSNHLPSPLRSRVAEGRGFSAPKWSDHVSCKLIRLKIRYQSKKCAP